MRAPDPAPRRQALLQAFEEALVSGEPGLRPIEMSAHDPVRYIGDMLAWIHTAAASERDALASLYGEAGPDVAAAIDAYMAVALSGVAKPFLVRVQQSAAGALDAVAHTSWRRCCNPTRPLWTS